jgi:hypothetical protein
MNLQPTVAKGMYYVDGKSHIPKSNAVVFDAKNVGKVAGSGKFN